MRWILNMNHAPGAGLITQPADLQSRAPLLCYGCPCIKITIFLQKHHSKQFFTATKHIHSLSISKQILLRHPSINLTLTVGLSAHKGQRGSGCFRNLDISDICFFLSPTHHSFIHSCIHSSGTLITFTDCSSFQCRIWSRYCRTVMAEHQGYFSRTSVNIVEHHI